jgi:hypothetical protein
VKIDWSTIELRDFAALVSEKLRQGGVETILVGGACVSIYTRNRYQSHDIDLVTSATVKSVVPLLSELGFHRNKTRHFSREGCPYFVDFVAPPAALGSEPVIDRNVIKTRLGQIVMLTATDSVKDRLAAYYHWKDPQSFEQAVLITETNEINLEEVERWSRTEGQEERYLVFFKRLGKHYRTGVTGNKRASTA